jgi:hypothetical protein
VGFIKKLFQREAVTENTVLPQYHTIFGFTTNNKIAAAGIDIIYWFIIFVAYCFAFHALNIILISWHWLLITLASLAVIGLPYCVKIILFGRKEFPFKAASLCLFLSLLPTIFDFAGLYSETGVQDSLKMSKVQITDTLSYFEAESKKAVQQQQLEINNEGRVKKEEVEKVSLSKSTELKQQVESANQEVIDERQGVKGKAGDGPRAKELQAQVRKLQAQSDIELQSSKTELKKQNDAIDQEIVEKLQALERSNKLLDEKIITCKRNIEETTNFKDLELAVIDANSLISSIASTLNTKFTPVKILGTDNIIKVSFNALLSADTTALVCFLLAFLMEVGDIIIVYTIRYEKKAPIPIIQKEDDSYLRRVKYTKTYEGY